ncbi:hypothetical protein AMTRI_Chr09g39700 [Amborella trichopoda]|nr:endoglucanase 23 isoform X1 [Amborella trichopoda]|eukprot:XP_011625208.1 endoglucanase 23 isoform X1 [Amborella trichopoda]
MPQLHCHHSPLFLSLLLLSLHHVLGAGHDYADALSKCILFFEGQRSGRLPARQRVRWRGDSALSDGQAGGVDLEGGYYDAGDNVKFGFPLAFTTTMLAWGMSEFGAPGEVDNAMAAIRWATDYLLKAVSQPGRVFVQVGDPAKDHNCWERPEDMDTPRTVYSVDAANPGSEVAAETAAALAAASIAFRSSDSAYSQTLLQNAVRVFEFADNHRGAYSDNPSLKSAVCPFYCDFSGYQDELLWGAAWLGRATGNETYLNYIQNNRKILGADENINEFGWDNKHAGFNVLISQEYLVGNVTSLQSYKEHADSFICTLISKSTFPHIQYTPGGLIYRPGGSNMQHVSAIAFLLLAYANYLSLSSQTLPCGTLMVGPAALRAQAKRQVDYILGDNPMNMSYMVGYGDRYPLKIHHRGSSLPSIVDHPQLIACKEGFVYFSSSGPNPNMHVGAVVGGPGKDDKYNDDRAAFRLSEPTTYINAPLVGVLAYFVANPS